MTVGSWMPADSTAGANLETQRPGDTEGHRDNEQGMAKQE